MMDGDGARRLGEKLLGDVETCGLGEILGSLRELITPSSERKYFNIPELDALLPQRVSPTPATTGPSAPTEPQSHNINSDDDENVDDDLWHPPGLSSPLQNACPTTMTTTTNQNLQHPKPLTTTTTTTPPRPPILELVSPPATQNLTPLSTLTNPLLYHLTSTAILPSTLSLPPTTEIPLHGQSSAIILLDPFSHFSVQHLTQHLLSYVSTKCRAAGRDLSHPAHAALRKHVVQIVHESLAHVHIWRPRGWDGVMGVLEVGIWEWLYNGLQGEREEAEKEKEKEGGKRKRRRRKHRSINRRIHALILLSLDVFTPQIFSSSTTTSPSPFSTASTHLTTALSNLTTTLLPTALTVLTSSSSTSTAFPSFRPALSLPASWPLTRLALQKVPVLKFAPGMCVEEAEGEREQRWGVVRKGRVECWRVEGRVGDGRGGTSKGKGRGVEGFVFRVREGVVEVEGEGERA